MGALAGEEASSYSLERRSSDHASIEKRGKSSKPRVLKQRVLSKRRCPRGRAAIYGRVETFF